MEVFRGCMVLAMAAAIDQIRRCLQEIAAIAWERQTRESACVPLPRHLRTDALCFMESLFGCQKIYKLLVSFLP